MRKDTNVEAQGSSDLSFKRYKPRYVDKPKKRFAWSDIVPEKVADDQRRWERAREIRRMFTVGFSEEQIAAKFGLSQHTVHRIKQKSFIYQDPKTYELYVEASPVERYLLGHYSHDLIKLAGLDTEPT